MARVKVWNDNVYPHTEKFKGTMISIEPGAFIEMDDEEATEFLSQFTGRKIRGDGTDDPRYFKKLRKERPKEAPVVEMPLVNHADGKVAASPAELAAMMAQYKHLQAHDADAERAAASKVDAMVAENESLKARLAALEARFAEPAKRGPGRPRKEANA